MKKLWLVILAFTFVFALSACEEQTENKDTVKPVITGANSVTINVGTPFDPTDGVEAEDDVDGVLTDQITITGEVDINKPGDYILTYRVKDKSDNEAIAQRVVTVKGLAGFLNGDFSDGLNGWSSWFNQSQGVNVEYSTEDGVAIIDIKEQSVVMDNNWWDVQLSQKTLSLTAFESYTLRFTVSAEANRKMMVQVQGGGLPQKPIGEHMVDVTTEEQIIEIDFYSTETSTAGVELQFAFGTFHKVQGVPLEEQTILGKVYLKNIEIIAGPELENQAPTLNVGPDVLLPVGATNFLVKGGISVKDDRDQLTINDVIFEDISEVPYEIGQPAQKGTYTFRYTVSDSEGLETVATRKLYVADPFDLPSFDVIDEQTNLPVGYETWFEETRGGLTATTANGVVEIEITNIAPTGGNIWENQFKIMNLAAFMGNYQLSFEAKADTARAIVVAMEGNGGVNLENMQVVKNLTTEWQTYTLDFSVNVNATIKNRNLQFWFGSLVNIEGFTTADDILTTLYFRNIDIVKTDEINYGDEVTFDYVQGFWADNATSVSPETDAIHNRYLAVNPLPMGLLPVGSVITVESGYQYRIIFLEKQGDGFKVVKRLDNSTSPYFEITEGFFDMGQYVSFNVSSVPTVDISMRLEEVASKLKIYHPEGTMDNHIDLEFVVSQGHWALDNTQVTSSNKHLSTNPLTPAFYNFDMVLEVGEGYQFAYVTFGFESGVYTVLSVSEYQTEPLWVNESFSEGKELIAFNVTSVDEESDLTVEDFDSIVSMHPNQIPHVDYELTYSSGYYAASATALTPGTDAFSKGFAGTNILSKMYFDDVEAINIKSGYQARFVFFSYDGYGNYKVTRRTDNLTGMIILDEILWAEDQYVAFNISSLPARDLSLELENLPDQFEYTLKDLVFVSGYWNTNQTQVTTGVNYIASSVLPRTVMNAGNTVTIEEGYEGRVIFLNKEGEGYKVMARSDLFTGTLVLTEAAFKNYQYIAFNLSKKPASNIELEIEVVSTKISFGEFTDELVPHVDQTLSFQTGYYEDNKTKITTGDTTFIKGFGVSNVLSIESLADYSSLTIAEGYQVRVVFLGYDHNTYTVMLRSQNLTGTIVLDEAFIGNYEYIAFNISSIPSRDLSGELESLPSLISFNS
ncbi:hypothetical protein BN85300580 [Paracholeplasma brassicae]|uniref:Pesticidal crystal protein Cry22Aa Ig-like domain-containing protein n=1 Tax=Acholeplasma brassicae TaxID=61635 RepID=U4KSJ9_9MOLU|nr:DUF5011 domain-containing protein [Paracholeplasma brassicae]CCV65079.1 hypothetical protein BN85300580 [Paracholeplasma brassicae]